jgi:DMSO/TMAO reductase YedYZ molybdopterin-dependent catalytic subunit
MNLNINKKISATLYRFTNIAILASLSVLAISGVYSFFPTRAAWLVDIHRIAAWVFVGCLPVKVGISWRSLKRGLGKRADRNVVIGFSILQALMVIAILYLGFTWTWRIGPQTWFRSLALWWHWMLAIILIVPVALHVWRRWPRPKREDFLSRRGALKMLGLGAVGIAGWWLAETLAEAREDPTAPRILTGSRLNGEFSANAFPITSEPKPTIDLATWTLSVSGAVTTPMRLSYPELIERPYSEIEAILDCTNGWWTVQQWGGVQLEDLLNEVGMKSNAIAIRMTAATRYTQVFTLREASGILIGTHVGGETLSEWHGFPARAVVPSRRGWFWVKWLTGIVVMDSLDEVLRAPISIR